MKSKSALPQTLVREELAIKFVNTVAWRLRDPIEDRVPSPETMLKWMRTARLLDRTGFEQIRTDWKKSSPNAATFLVRAVELREATYRLLAPTGGKPTKATDLEILSRHLVGPSRGIALADTGGVLNWRAVQIIEAETLLKPIAWSAASLLMGPRADRVKQCQDERGCGWLFIDESRAQNRRWCSMGDCGNLAKSRRHFQRLAAKP